MCLCVLMHGAVSPCARQRVDRGEGYLHRPLGLDGSAVQSRYGEVGAAYPDYMANILGCFIMGVVAHAKVGPHPTHAHRGVQTSKAGTTPLHAHTTNHKPHMYARLPDPPTPRP